MSASGSPSRWQKHGDRSLAATRIFDLRSANYRHPVRGTEREFVVIDAPDWVVVIGLTNDHRIVLVNQFRFGIDAPSLELPGGVIDRGENPVSAALRELREETGFAAAEGHLLGSVHPNPAIQNNTCHLVLASGIGPAGEVAWDHDEEIETLVTPATDVFTWARTGRITHALSLNALFMFEPHWAALRQESPQGGK